MLFLGKALAEGEQIAETAASRMNINVGQSLLYALIGFTIVFVALVIIIAAIKITSAVVNKGTKKEEPAKTVAPAAAAEAPKAAAPGSCGELKLYNVSDKDAAMIMAIVADELKTPLNELRFISIKEIA